MKCNENDIVDRNLCYLLDNNISLKIGPIIFSSIFCLYIITEHKETNIV